ncbi:unnamed protein product, partial [Iphiclides podalirius]
MNSRHDRICTLPPPPVFLDLAPTASFWQRVLFRARWTALPWEGHHGSAELIRSRRNLLLERRRQLSGHWMLCHPYSILKFGWDCFYSALTFVVFIYMPFQVFLNCPPPDDAFVLLCDAVAFLDIGATFLTGYTDEESKRVVLQPRAIARRYLRGGFATDLVAALPLQLYSEFDKCTFPTHTAMYLFKLPRLRPMQQKWVNLRKQLDLSYIATALLTVFFRTVLFFHWMTYIHYQVPLLCLGMHDTDTEWMKRFRSVWLPYESVLRKYTANLYLTCGLCIGAGYYTPVTVNIVPELLLTSFMGIVGLFFFVYCFTTLLRLVIYMQQEAFRYHGRLKELTEYMSLKRLPGPLRRKILLFLDHEFSAGYFNERHIMNTINERIKQDINMHCCKRLVDKVPMFGGMPIALTNTIIFGLIEYCICRER